MRPTRQGDPGESLTADAVDADQPATPRKRNTPSGPVVTRFLAKHFWSSASFPTLRETIGFQRRAYERATVVVRAYYAVSVYWAISATNAWPGYRQLKQAHPLWPAHWWFDAFSVRTSVDIIFCAYLAGSIIAMVLPQQRLARALYAIALLDWMAFVNGFDKINHDMHSWMFVSFVLVLLPTGKWSGRRRISERQYFLTVIWSAQLVILLFYTLTGFWKIYFGLTTAAHGQLSGFNLSGFSSIVANRVLQSSTKPILGAYFSRTELLGWALFVGTMYLESSSLLIAFRPRLQRLWGASLIFFHLGTQLAMGFTFAGNIVLVGLFLVCSPMVPETVHPKEMFFDLPVVHVVSGQLSSWRHRRVLHRAIADADPLPSVI